MARSAGHDCRLLGLEGAATGWEKMTTVMGEGLEKDPVVEAVTVVLLPEGSVEDVVVAAAVVALIVGFACTVIVFSALVGLEGDEVVVAVVLALVPELLLRVEPVWLPAELEVGVMVAAAV